MQKEIIQSRKSQNISVIIERHKNQKELVFVMHGLGGFKEQPHIQAIAEAFKEKDYTVVRFDTTNTIGESDGKLELATPTNYYEDLEDVIGWAKEQDWYQEPFYLVGHSLGGFCISFYTQNHSEKVKALASISAFISGKLFTKAFEVKESLERWKEQGYREWESSSIPGLTKRLNWSFVPDSLKYDLLEKAHEIKVPVILVVGEKDEDTPLAQQKILYEALNTKKELHVIKGAKHTFREEVHLMELKSILLNWIEKPNRF